MEISQRGAIRARRSVGRGGRTVAGWATDDQVSTERAEAGVSDVASGAELATRLCAGPAYSAGGAICPAIPSTGPESSPVDMSDVSDTSVSPARSERDARAVSGVSDTSDSAVTDTDLILDRKSTRLNSSHIQKSRMPSSA